jgi:hypothetical protein
MVWNTVGLLEDAIREHLEFKRRRGADPSDVARLEGEAFGDVRRGKEAHPPGSEAAPTGDERYAPDGGRASSVSDLSQASQETAELDMRTVFGAEAMESADCSELDSPAQAMSTVGLRAEAESPGSVGAATGELLEWELPGERYFSERLCEEQSPQRSLDAARGMSSREVLTGAPDALFDAPSQERPPLAKRFAQ